MHVRKQYCNHCLSTTPCEHNVNWQKSDCSVCGSTVLPATERLGGSVYCRGCVDMYRRQWSGK